MLRLTSTQLHHGTCPTGGCLPCWHAISVVPACSPHRPVTLMAIVARAVDRSEELARILDASHRPAEAVAARNIAEDLRRALR